MENKVINYFEQFPLMRKMQFFLVFENKIWADMFIY